MKTLKTLFVAALSLVFLNASAQTVDEIVAKNIAALGGAEKLSTLNSVKFEGTLSTQGIEIPVTLTRVHLKGMRVDLDIMGTANYQLANETKGWIFMPIQQMDAPQEMGPETHASFKRQMDIQSTFFNYKTKGLKVEFMGIEKVDNEDAYKMKVINGTDTSYYYISTQSNLLIKTQGTVEVNGSPMEMVSTFSDYRKNEDGFTFAYSTSTPQGPISFSKISTNIPVDEKIFTN